MVRSRVLHNHSLPHRCTQPQLTNTVAAYITNKQILPFEFEAVSAHFASQGSYSHEDTEFQDFSRT